MAALAVVPANVSAAEIELGILTCDAVPGTRLNLIVRSTVDIKCTFKHAGGEEHYQGETGIGLGIDLSIRTNEKFSFSVIAATELAPGNHAIAGKYVGGKASVSLGVGLGAAVLIGGSNDSFGLNPLALETNEGIGFAAGLGFLYIEPDK